MSTPPPLTEAGARRRLGRAEMAAILSVIAFVAIAGLATVITGADQVLAHLGRLTLGGVIVMLLLSLANYLLRAGRWRLFGRASGIRVPWWRDLLYYLAGLALTPTPGKAGEAMRLWLLERGEGVRYARALPLLVGDRVGDLHALLLIALAAAAFLAGASGGGGGGDAMNLTLILAATLVAMLGTLLLMYPGPLGRVIGAGHALVRSLRPPGLPRLFATLRHALRATGQLFRPRVLVPSLVLGGLGWGAEILAFALLLDLLGSPISLSAAALIFAAATIAGGLSMLPGGLGGTEAVMVAMLVGFDVPADVAIVATVVIRVTTLWFAVAVGFLVMPAALRHAVGRDNKKDNNP